MTRNARPSDARQGASGSTQEAPGGSVGERALIERAVAVVAAHARGGGPVALSAVREALGIAPEHAERFEALIGVAALQGRLVRDADGTLALPDSGGGRTPVVGRLIETKRGERLVRPNDRRQPLIAIGTRLPDDVREGDTVLAYTYAASGVPPRRARGRHARPAVPGFVAQVLRRRPERSLGVIERRAGRLRVRLLDPDTPHHAALTGALPPGLSQGTIVEVALLREPDARGQPRARLIEVHGHADSPADDALLVIGDFGLRREFAPDALAEAATLKEPEPSTWAADGARQDFTHLEVLAIDPVDAKDHDDAVSLQLRDDGRRVLGVHIADVSAVVTPGSALDREARERGATVYLPGHTLHMLPPRVAAKLCSLTEGAPRLAKSLFLTYDRAGRLVERRLVRSVIRTQRCLAYKDVLPVLQGQPAPRGWPRWLAPRLVEMRALADQLRAARLERGALVLDVARPRITLDEHECVATIARELQDESHNLVEEFMLAANQAVASFLIERGLPYLGRIHPAPAPEALAAFAEFAESLGESIPPAPTPAELQTLLTRLGKRPGAAAIHLALLKSMERAIYAAEPGLHYALQFRRYTHFTSPIRRYPDTLVHQLLDRYLAEGHALVWQTGDSDANADQANADQAASALSESWQQRFALEMPAVAAHCSQAQQRADTAELRLTERKIMRQLAGRLGEECEATVTGVVPWGLYCQLDDYWIDGLLGRETLDAEELLTERFAALVRTGGRTIRVAVGDRLRVTVGAVDLVEARLDLALAPGSRLGRTAPHRSGGAAPGGKSGKTPGQKRGGGGAARGGKTHSGTGAKKNAKQPARHRPRRSGRA